MSVFHPFLPLSAYWKLRTHCGYFAGMAPVDISAKVTSMLAAAIYLSAMPLQVGGKASPAPPPAHSKVELTLFDRIGAALASGQPTEESVARAFELSSKCDPSCGFGGSIGGVGYSQGSFRPTKDGLILVLGALDGDCIRIRSIVQHFPKGVIEDACSHGPCWYYTKRYEWGLISFGMKDIDSTCASSLVINSMPNQRLKVTE